MNQIRQQPVAMRIGGFGGIEGLSRYLREQNITHVVDATHPFADQMSRHAIAACADCNIPLLALSRPPWQPQSGDRWHHVADLAAAVSYLDQEQRRVMLAIGRMYLPLFYAHPQHHYLLRLVDPPEAPLDFPSHQAIISRGPFSLAGDKQLLQDHKIDLIISKNAGGTGAYAKIEAARDLGIEVVMIDRPELPERAEVHSPEDVLDWLA